MAIKKLANNSNQPPQKNAAQTGGAKNAPQVKKISLNAPIKTSSVVNQKTDSIFNSSGISSKKPAISLSSEEEQEAMQAIFFHLDTDEDGKISEEELTYLTSMHDDNDEGEEITEEDVNLYLEKMEGERQQTLERFQGALGQWVGGIDDVIAKYFPSKSLDEISDEDIQRAIFADMLSSNTANARNNIEQYFDSEGWADDAYNWLKGVTDLGITHDDITEYLQNEEMFNNILLSSLNNGGSLELVDSDEPQEELLANGQISTSMLQGIIEQRLSNASSIEEIMDYSQNYLGLDGEDVLNSIMSAMLDQQLKYGPYCAQYNPEDLQFEITQGEDGQYYISSDYDLISGKACNVNGLTVDEYFELYSGGGIQQNSDIISASISSKWLENTPESISFDDTYSFFTGVKYDPQAIQEANEAQIVYQHALSLQQGASYQEELFASFDSPRQVYDYFVQMYENDPSAQSQFTAEEYASSMFNSYYDSLFENGLVAGDARIDLRCTSFHISPDGKTITEVYSAGDLFSESYLDEGDVYDEKTGTVTRQYNIEYDPVSDSYYSQTLSDTFACINRAVDDQNLFVQSTIDGFNEQYGENAFNFAIQDYQEKFETAYGNNILNSKFDSYQVDMDSYSQKLSTFIAMGGFAMSFINPAFGLVALGGAYTDNAIDLVNLATNEKGGEFGGWFLSTMKDVCYTAVGFKLGAWANQSGNKVMGFLMNKGVSQNAALGLGTGSEYVFDVASGTVFDLVTSYMETGNMYLAQNLLNNFLFGSADFRGGVGLYRALHAGYDIDVDVSGNIKVVDPSGANSARPAVFGSADTIRMANSGMPEFDWKSIPQSDDFGCADIATLNALADKPMLQQALEQSIDYDPSSRTAVFEYAGEKWVISDVDSGANMIEILHNAYLANNPQAKSGDFVKFVANDLLGANGQIHVPLSNQSDIDLPFLSRLSSNDYTIMTLALSGDEVRLDDGTVLLADHAYTISKINEDGSMIIIDPYEPSKNISVSGNDFTKLKNAEITGASLSTDFTDGADGTRVNGIFDRIFGKKTEEFEQDYGQAQSRHDLDAPRFRDYRGRAIYEPTDVIPGNKGVTLSNSTLIDMGGYVFTIGDSDFSSKIGSMKVGQKLYIGGDDSCDIVIPSEYNLDGKRGYVRKLQNGSYAFYDCPGYSSTLNPSNIVRKSQTSPQRLDSYMRQCEIMGHRPLQDGQYLAFQLESDLFGDKYIYGRTFWNDFKAGLDNDMCAWKMHIYSADSDDFIDVASGVLPYLQENGVNHKTLGRYKTPEDLAASGDGSQRGKAITIYPKSIQDMETIARDLDFIIRKKGLTTDSSSISGDQIMGSTGRLFYRYEFKSGEYAYGVFSAHEAHGYYEPNRSNRGLKYPYLASDMDISQDPFLYFDPSDPNSHVRVQTPKNNAQSLSTPLTSNIPTRFFPTTSEIYVGGLKLDLKSPEISTKLESLKPGEKLTVGRYDAPTMAAPPDIAIQKTAVSRKHGYITKGLDGYYYFVDTGSLNGTMIINH